MLVASIERHLRTRPRAPREKGCFHPSDLHKRISTLVNIYLCGDDTTFPSRTLRIFDNGLGLQERLVTYFHEMGILVDRDVAATDDKLEIRGTADCVVELAGHKRVIELKSINKKGFTALRKPVPAHLIQVNTYMHCLGIPQGYLLYENKDSQELLEFGLALDQNIVSGFTSKIKQCQHIIARLRGERFTPLVEALQEESDELAKVAEEAASSYPLLEQEPGTWRWLKKRIWPIRWGPACVPYQGK